MANKTQFTNEEKLEISRMGARLASHAVLSVLCDTILEKTKTGSDKQTEKAARKLINRVGKVTPYKDSQPVQLEIENSPIILCVYLSKGLSQWQTQVMVPQGYERDLMTQYNHVKNIAVIYWQQFKMENEKLVEDIANFRSDVSFADLVIDKDLPTSLYFDPNCQTRVHITCGVYDTETKQFSAFK